MAWWRVEVRCAGVPPHLGAQGALDIADDFRARTWHRNVIWRWDGSALWLSVENDFDPDGRALFDEFSDELSACIRGGFDGDLRLISSEKLDD